MQTPNSNNGNNYMSNNNRNGQQHLHSAGSSSGGVGGNAFSFFSASPSSSSHQQFVSNNTMFSALPWQLPHPQFYQPPMAPPPGFHQQQQQQPPQPNSSFMQQSTMLPPNNPYMLRWPWQTNYYNHHQQQQQQQFIQPWQWQTPAQAHPAAMALLSPQHQQFGMSTPVHQQQQQLLLHATAGNLLGKEYVGMAHQQHPAPAHQQQMLNATATPGYPQAQEDHTLANQQPAQQQLLLTGTGSISNEIRHHNGTSDGTLAQQQPPLDMTAQAQQLQIDISGESIGQTAGEPPVHINPRAMHSISLSAAAEKATREIAAKMAMAANGQQQLVPPADIGIGSTSSATGSGEVLQLQQQQQQPYLVDEPSSSVGSRCATTTATECGSSSSQLLAADGDVDGAFNSPPMATDTVFCQRPPNPETTNAADSAADKAMSTPSTSTAAAAASVHWNARRQLDSLLTALGQQKPTKSSAKSSAMKSKTKTTMKAIKTTKTSAETAKTKAQTKTSSKTRKVNAKTTTKAKVMGRNVALKDDRIRKMVAAYADWAVENPEDRLEGLAILTEQVTAICGPYPKLRKILYGRAFTFTWNKRRKEKKQLLIDSMAPQQQSSRLQQPKVAKKKLKKKKRKAANKKTPVSATKKKKKQTTAGRNCQLEANGITSPTQWAISSVPDGHSGSLKMRLRARREDEQQQQTAGAASSSNSNVAATTAAEEPPAAEQKCSANLLLSDDFYEGLSRVLNQISQRPSVKTESPTADDVEMKSMPMPCAGKEEEPGSSLQQFAATMLPPRKNSGGGHSINDASLVSNAATSGTTSSSSKWTSKFVHAEHFADDEKPAARGFRIDGVKQLGQLTRALEQIGQMGKEKERGEAEAAKVPMPRIAKLSVHLRGAMTERPGQRFLTKNKDDHYELERPKSAGECGQSPTSGDADDDDDEWHPTGHHHSIGKKRRWVDRQRRPLRSNNGELVNVDECQLVMAPAMANELLGELPKCEECDRTFCKAAYFLHMLTSHGTVVEVTKMVLDHLRQLNAAQFAQITWKCQHCHFECHRFEQYAQHCEREEHRNQNQRKKYSHKDVRQIEQEIRGREAENRRCCEEKCQEEKCQCREGDEEDHNYGTGGESGECRPMTKPEVDGMPLFPIGYFEANEFGKQ